MEILRAANYFHRPDKELNNSLNHQRLSNANQLYAKAQEIDSASIAQTDFTAWANCKARLALYELMLSKPKRALQLCEEALLLNEKAKELKRTLAPAYLLNGQYEKAMEVYQRVKSEKYGFYAKGYTVRNYEYVFFEDLKQLELAGVIPEEHRQKVAAIKEMLNKR